MATHRSLAVAICAVAVLLVGCGSTLGSEDEELSDRAAQLGFVAGAVDGLVKFGNPSPTLTGDELLMEATKDNPSLLAPFSNYYVTARRQGNFSSVLMCNASRQRGLAEDAGCTSVRLDEALWKESRSAPCSFTLDLAQVCKTP